MIKRNRIDPNIELDTKLNWTKYLESPNEYTKHAKVLMDPNDLDNIPSDKQLQFQTHEWLETQGKNPSLMSEDEIQETINLNQEDFNLKVYRPHVEKLQKFLKKYNRKYFLLLYTTEYRSITLRSKLYDTKDYYIKKKRIALTKEKWLMKNFVHNYFPTPRALMKLTRMQIEFLLHVGCIPEREQLLARLKLYHPLADVIK